MLPTCDTYCVNAGFVNAALRANTIKHGRDIVIGMIRCRIPVIAAVNGPAVGLGCSLAAMSDVVYMSDKAHFADPHVQFRKLRVDVPRADGAMAATIASPLRLQGTPVQYTHAPPTLGEHTDEVLGGLLGKSADEIAKLKAGGII